MKNYVIIGNGPAAAGCIEGIRSIDRDGKITVISSERYPVYCRPLISYYLEGKTDIERIKYRPENFYMENGCEVIYGKSAVKIDNGKKVILLNDESKIFYDELCIATGSDPFIPDFDGIESVGDKYSFMTLDDALAIEKAVSKNSKVLIIGAGLIGLKCAEGLRDRVESITVCDLADRVLSSILDSDCAQIMQRHLERCGISFMLGDSAAKFRGNTALMKSGKQVDFDILVLAVGVKANISLLKDIGGMCGRGIIVDDHMRTSVSGIYAAGDCTECTDISCGESKVIAILPNAYMQGKCAGINMAGAQEAYDKAIPMNSIGFFGLHAMTAGSYFGPEQNGEIYEEKSEDKIKRLFTKDGLLTGFILIGNTDKAGIYTNMVRNRIPLSEVDYERLKKSPDFVSFGAEYRKKKFGSVV